MADFRKLLPALALFALIAMLSVPASAQVGQAFTCVNNAGVPPTVRAEGITELVGDLVLNCSGTAGVVPAAGITANVQIFLNTNVTSRLVGAGTEALLILNETTAGAATYQGTLAGSNSIVWLGVPILGAGSTSSIVRITNVRANASGVTSINPNLPSSLIPAQIVAFISITGSTSVPVNNPQQIIAFAQQGLVTSVSSGTYRQCITATPDSGQPDPMPSISFSEGFASAFKPRIATDQSPSMPGVSYNSESGYIPGDGTVVGLTSVAGIGTADSGTRLQAVFTNIPAGATVNVPTVIGTSDGSYAWLTNASSTDPGFGEGGVTWYALAASGTTATATYEVGASNPFGLDALTGPVALTYTSNPGGGVPGTTPMSAALGFGNLSTTTTASSSALIPRFIDTSSAKTIATVSACVTNLLFPYVTTVPGFDTGIAIANTGVDVTGLTTTSAGQSGTCTMYMFGTGAPATAPVTASVAAGTVYAWSLYNGSADAAVPAVAGFSGYVIARCNFQYGHGYAFVSNLGLGPTGWAQSYLALVIPDRSGTRPVDNIGTAGPGSGEVLGQ